MSKRTLLVGVLTSIAVTALGAVMPPAALAAKPSAQCDAATAFDPAKGGFYEVAVNGLPAGSSLPGAGITSGDLVTVTYTVAAGCAGTPVGLAAYRNPAATFQPDVTQTLADAQVRNTGSGVLQITVPVPTTSSQCTILQNPYPSDGPGANSSGPPDNGSYNPTCSEPGRHGNQPATGSVGNADTKNPPGQAPDGTDGNAGYECDRNQGIGKGNPAHTSCAYAGWQIDLFVGQVLQTIGPPDSYYNTGQPIDRLVDYVNS